MVQESYSYLSWSKYMYIKEARQITICVPSVLMPSKRVPISVNPQSTRVARSTVYNSQDMEATKMPISRRMDKEAVVHIHRGILLSY